MRSLSQQSTPRKGRTLYKKVNDLTEWLVKQFTSFNVLLFLIIVVSNYITTTRAMNKQLKEQRLYEELEEIKEEINKENK
jgi:hypothetical protein